MLNIQAVGPRTFGAVVLTLYAIGLMLLLVIVSVCVMRLVNGPDCRLRKLCQVWG